jgi:uncharacterized protein YjbI with pentapeptide repeats
MTPNPSGDDTQELPRTASSNSSSQAATSLKKLNAEQITAAKRRNRGIFDHHTEFSFVDADAQGADLSNTTWTGEDFSNCDLSGANLSSCQFRNANFNNANLWNADLKDSDLSEAINLLPAQLSGTDLTRAKLPQELETFEPLTSVERLSQSAANVFLTILAVVAYTFLTIATTKDSELVTNSASSKLPVIGVDIPIVPFFVVTPLLLTALFAYFHIYLVRLWEAIAQLPAIFPNGRRLDEKTYPWLLNDMVREYVPRLHQPAPPLSLTQAILCIFAGYWLVPITLACICLYLFRVQNWPIIIFHLLLLALAVSGSCYSTHLANITLSRNADAKTPTARLSRLIGAWWGLPQGLVVLAITLGFAFTVLECDHHLSNKKTPGFIALWRTAGTLLRDRLTSLGLRTAPKVEDADLSTRPANWTGLPNNIRTELAQTKPARFTTKSWRRLTAKGSFLAHAELGDPQSPTSADFKYGDFTNATLYRATFSHVDFTESKFVYAKLALENVEFKPLPPDQLAEAYRIDKGPWITTTESADILNCRFNNTSFKEANLQYVLIRYSEFISVKFAGAHCAGAIFLGCQLDRTDFTGADLRWAHIAKTLVANRYPEKVNFESADCSDASFERYNLARSDFKNAVLRRAKFVNVDLTDANLEGAVLDQTDFTSATGLKPEQLQKAKTRTGLKLSPQDEKKLDAACSRSQHP